MSHVQLPSSALERLVARGTFPLHTRTSVCRSLFGPVDHDARCRDATAKLREISERDRQRWNFNFDTYTPMAGVYEWEEAEETPAFYRETGVKRSPSSDRPDMDAPERLSAPESSAPSPVEVNRVDQLSSGTRTPVPSVKRNRAEAADNTNITDFFVKRKRACDKSSSDSSSSSRLPKSSVLAEQTPRKRLR